MFNSHYVIKLWNLTRVFTAKKFIHQFCEIKKTEKIKKHCTSFDFIRAPAKVILKYLLQRQHVQAMGSNFKQTHEPNLTHEHWVSGTNHLLDERTLNQSGHQLDHELCNRVPCNMEQNKAAAIHSSWFWNIHFNKWNIPKYSVFSFTIFLWFGRNNFENFNISGNNIISVELAKVLS